MSALQQIKEKEEIVYAYVLRGDKWVSSKGVADIPINEQMRKAAIHAQSQAHLMMVRRGRK